MITDEEEFSMALRTLADHDPVSAVPSEQLLHRARRARRGRTAAMTTGAFGTVAVLVAVAAGLGGFDGPSGDAGTPPVATADSPNIRLAAAAQATSQGSFKFMVTVHSDTVELGRPRSGSRSYEGAYDPAGPTGYLRDPRHPQFENRMIGKDCYTLKMTRWSKHRCAASSSVGGSYIGDIGIASSAEPAARLNELAGLGNLTDLGTSGTGATAVRAGIRARTAENRLLRAVGSGKVVSMTF